MGFNVRVVFVWDVGHIKQTNWSGRPQEPGVVALEINADEVSLRPMLNYAMACKCH